MILQRPKLNGVSAAALATALSCGMLTDRCSAIHIDYLVEQDGAGNLVTGVNDFDTNQLSIPERLFNRDLDTNFFGSDPGFSAVSQANVPAGYFALSPNTPLNFDLLGMPLYATTVSNLWHWDGNGSVNFQPMAAGTSMTVYIGFSSAVVTGSANDVTGFTLQTTTDTGAMHRHPNYQLAGGPGGTPPQGLYMIAEHTRMTGLQTSIPFYTIFVTDAISDASYNAAVQWGLTHLLLPGDVNNDAIVNGQDIAAIASHWLVTGPIADANYDGIVNGQDIALAASHWLQTSGGEMGSAVPEPSSAALAIGAVVAALATLRWRYRATRSA